MSSGDAGPRSDEIIVNAQTSSDISHIIGQRALESGFDRFIVLKVTPRPQPRIADLCLLTNWPEGMLAAYDENDMGSVSPVLERLSQSAIGFQFSIEPPAADKAACRIAAAQQLFLTFSISQCAYFPVHAPDFGPGAIGYGGAREPLCEEEMTAMQLFSIAAFDRLIALRREGGDERPKLSDRERECLAWTAEGKTSFEIGKIIGLSEHTVNYYLNTAATKLDATNRAQAVATALRMGILG